MSIISQEAVQDLYVRMDIQNKLQFRPDLNVRQLPHRFHKEFDVGRNNSEWKNQMASAFFRNLDVIDISTLLQLF
jgi:hypothetical protein